MISSSVTMSHICELAPSCTSPMRSCAAGDFPRSVRHSCRVPIPVTGPSAGIAGFSRLCTAKAKTRPQGDQATQDTSARSDDQSFTNVQRPNHTKTSGFVRCNSKQPILTWVSNYIAARIEHSQARAFWCRCPSQVYLCFVSSKLQ